MRATCLRSGVNCRSSTSRERCASTRRISSRRMNVPPTSYVVAGVISNSTAVQDEQPFITRLPSGLAGSVSEPAVTSSAVSTDSAACTAPTASTASNTEAGNFLIICSLLMSHLALSFIHVENATAGTGAHEIRALPMLRGGVALRSPGALDAVMQAHEFVGAETGNAIVFADVP